MSRKKKKNSYHPGKKLQNKRSLGSNSETDLEKVIFFSSNSTKIPYSKLHGSEAEQEIMKILQTSNIPSEMVLKPKLVKVPSSGEIEISDGIILYGDTAFLMQIKSRNLTDNEIDSINKAIDPEDMSVVDYEVKKIKKLVSHAYKQCKNSLSYMEEKVQVEFENQNGNITKINYKDYNWVSLILINHPSFSDINYLKVIEEDSNDNREVPRVIMSVQDLEIMSSGFNRIPYYILNYLRRLQYQSNHELGNDAKRFTNFMVNGIHDYEKHNYFIEYEKFIMEIYDTKAIDKTLVKHLLYPLDFSTVEKMTEVQQSFKSKFENSKNLPCNDLMVFSESRIGYATLFYDSKRLFTEKITSNQLEGISVNYLIERKADIDLIVTIAVDVCPENPHRTVGYLAGVYHSDLNSFSG